MIIHNGLICDAGHVEDNVFYNREDGPPPCPACDGERRVWWGHRQAPALFSDEKPPLDLGPQASAQAAELATTRSGQKKLKAQLEAAHPGKRIVFEPPSHERLVEHEELRQKTIDYRKAGGLDEQTAADLREAKKAKAAEAANAVRAAGGSEGQAKQAATEAANKELGK